MFHVNNKTCIRRLSLQLLRASKGRNRIAVLSILLTALLFTSLFMGCSSLILSRRQTEIVQTMDASHAAAQDLSAAQMQRLVRQLKQNHTVARWGTGTFLGIVKDKRFGFSVEVRSGDDALAESFQCQPSSGRMPRRKDEIAVSSLVLDALGAPHKLGQEITLTYERDDVHHINQTDTFRVVGIWAGNKAVLSQLVWVAPRYADAMAYPVTQRELENGVTLCGGHDCVVWYRSLWKLKQNTQSIAAAARLSESGTTRGGFTVNPAYDMTQEDSFSFSSAVLLLFGILLAGYLIIYNVFQLSVQRDIRTYGLLKNVGATGRQLSRIVRWQAWLLSAIGIPLGLALGYLVGRWMAPSLTAQTDTASTAQTVISASPLLFAAAALFTLLTVYLSTMKACRLVKRVSPVEALHLAESESIRRKRRRPLSVSWYGMAAQNMLRSWQKNLVVMVSLALSLLVVNCTVMLVQGYNFNEYRKIFLASDFQLSQLTATLDTANLGGITPKIQRQLNACPNATTGYVYYSAETHTMESSLRRYWTRYAKQADWTQGEKDAWKQIKQSGEIPVHYLGISKTIFDKLEWTDKPCSWEKFSDGKHCLVGYNETPYYQSGDTVAMQYQSGASASYTVLGCASLPYSLDFPYYDPIYITVLVPEREFIHCAGSHDAMYAALDAREGQRETVQAYIQNTVLSQNDMLTFTSVLDLQAAFDRYLSKYYTIGGFLVLVLALIGVMNFFNTTATSVLSRRRELALLEAVGMTKRQIVKMLIAEGAIYLVGAFAIAVVLVYTCAERLLNQTLGLAFYCDIHATALPCLALAPVLLLIAVLIPKWQFRQMCRESIVERLRGIE